MGWPIFSLGSVSCWPSWGTKGVGPTLASSGEPHVPLLRQHAHRPIRSLKRSRRSHSYQHPVILLGSSCRNSGIWGSPDDAKVGPTSWARQEGKQGMESRQEMGNPISSRRWTRHARTPEGEWVASGSNLSLGHRSRQEDPWVPWSCRRQDYSWRLHPY